MKRPFHFHTPPEFNKTIRDIAYNRIKGKTFQEGSIQDEEDIVAVLTDIVEQSMNQAYRIGYALGTEYGQSFAKN